MEVVQGLVSHSRTAEFESGYARSKVAPRSSGYLGSHLLKRTTDAGTLYRLEIFWDTRESLDKGRTGPRGDWAANLFISADTLPVFELYEVAGDFRSDPCPRGPVSWD